jgi:hypothetical protein
MPTQLQLLVTAVDPLAEQYDDLLRDAGLVPPVRTLPGSGEELLEQFGSPVDISNPAIREQAKPGHRASAQAEGVVSRSLLEEQGA